MLKEFPVTKFCRALCQRGTVTPLFGQGVKGVSGNPFVNWAQLGLRLCRVFSGTLLLVSKRNSGNLYIKTGFQKSGNPFARLGYQRCRVTSLLLSRVYVYAFFSGESKFR